jgi:uncharacterized protein (DUF427 family)
MNPAPGFKKRPDHRIALTRSPRRVQVKAGGDPIADTRNALEMKEGDYAVVYYIPREDVRMERLARSSHSTYCPFKGNASYYSFVGGPENAVWSYEAPYDEMALIRGFLAFYPDKAEISVT